jgi:transposase InsO family protein
VGRNAVQLIMRELGIKGLPTRRLPRASRIAKVTSLDLVRRDFARDRPDLLWMTDIERHEALHDRVEVRDLRGLPVAAGGSKLGAA